MSQSRIYSVISHFAGWLIFFSLIIMFTSNSPGGVDTMTKLFSLPFLYFYFIYLFIFYLNFFVLIPKLYLQKKYPVYFILILLLFVGMYLTKPFDHLLHQAPPPEQMGPPRPNSPQDSHLRIDIVSIVLFVMAWALSTAICIIRQWRITQQQAIKAETERANAELSFLKAQINPHFLFNTLNNLYTLAVTKNEKTADSIMKFSNIMRYVTDEMARNVVPLQSEIDCIKDYIDLQRLRLNEKTYVDFSITCKQENKTIAPLLLMTFVENVFKYGVSSHEASTITIKIFAEEKTIHFLCQNEIFNNLHSVDRAGIGITNAKKRLEYLYPNKHLLNIVSKNDLYTVELTLQA